MSASQKIHYKKTTKKTKTYYRKKTQQKNSNSNQNQNKRKKTQKRCPTCGKFM